MNHFKNGVNLTFLLLLITTPSIGFVSNTVAVGPEDVRFNEHVRPILATCSYCHGPDPKTREAGMRLDMRESAIRDNESVRARRPGVSRQNASRHVEKEVKPQTSGY